VSELMVKVGNSTGYHDGACIHAFTDCRVLCCQAQNKLFEKDSYTKNCKRADGEGLLPVGDAAQDYYEQTHQFRFQRTGSNTATVTRLSDGDTIAFESNKPFVQHDGKTVQMDILKWMQKKKDRRHSKEHGGMPMFGTVGREIWYGGRTTIDDAKVANIWTAIENKLGLDRNAHKKWPVGNLDIKHFLNVPLAALTDKQAQFIEQPGMLPRLNPETGLLEPQMVEKRTSRVEYDSLPGLDPAIRRMIPDRLLPVDIRDLYLFEVGEILVEGIMNSPFLVLEDLKAEITNDPLGLYTGLDNSEIVEAINAKSRTYKAPISSAELLAWAAQASAGEDPRILKLQEAAASHAVKQIKGLAWAAVKMVERDATSLDLNLSDRQAMLDALVAGGALSAADKAALESLATVTGSRAEELFGEGVVVYQSHVDHVRPL